MKSILKILGYTILAIAILLLYYKYVNWADNISKPICDKNDLIISDWWECKNGIQERNVRIIDTTNNTCKINAEKFPITQSCQNTVPLNNTKAVKIFNNKYYTSIDTNNSLAPYKPSYNNLNITLNWKIKSLKMTVLGETEVNGWKKIFIPEYYYYMFSIGEAEPRALNTIRTKTNRLDTNSEGVFQGIYTPKRLVFDLSKSTLATTSSELSKTRQSSINRNYVDILNKNTWKTLNMTLFMGDWQSMTNPDLMQRIFWVITDAYLEYECVDNSACNIIVE